MNRREGQRKGVLCRLEPKARVLVKEKDVSSHQSITSQSHQTLQPRGHNWRRIYSSLHCVCSLITVALCGGTKTVMRFHPDLTRAGVAGGGLFLGSCPVTSPLSEYSLDTILPLSIAPILPCFFFSSSIN